MGLCRRGTQVVRDASFVRDIVGGSGAEALRFVGAPEENQAAAAAAATGFVAGGIAGLQPARVCPLCALSPLRTTFDQLTQPILRISPLVRLVVSFLKL